MRTWQRLSALAVGAALLTVTACGGGSDDSTDTGDGGGTGGTFSVGIDEPDSLIPGRAQGAFDEMHALFSGLVKFGDQSEPQMLHAESIESDDNIVWTITIKPDWTFHNGEPVTAQSYADAWNATAYGPNAWVNNALFAQVVGYDELNPAQGEPTAQTLSGVEVVDDTTLRVTLKAADSQFPYKLGNPGFYPLPTVAFEDFDAFNEAPIGNGPYQMDGTWEHDVQLSVTRYEDYQGPETNADSITFRIYSDTTTAYTDAIGGSVDIVSVPQEKYKQVDSDFADNFVAFEAVRLDWLGFPLWDPRFQDPRIRQAVSMAIDRDAVNEAIFGGLYTPATSLHGPTTIGGGTEGLCGEFCEFDPDAAKQLLAEAGGWEGPMEIWFPGGVGYDQTFEALANQIRQNLGIAEVTLQSQPGFVQFLDALRTQQASGPFRGGWGSLYPSMQNQLTAVFSSSGDGREGAGGYTNAEVDALIAQADGAPTPEEAVELYKQAEEQIMADFPVVPLFYAKYVYAHSDNVSNVIIGFDQIELNDVVVEN
ncbi:peptide ABC transporter substrate-binding protein [Jiangella gansuensis]|uniref:peptide ABC transporter substrate-binding protein n=1 Tax=Jiangella gansuensis TaxID=281473 RepID=UPI00047AB2FF|nr:ABC transporter substrate-binding protein [Jiangella gansuensis]